ncbi:MAG: tetratricopeptide repeat protein [Deltaproteobacteria bacterium]|nr:tetratricopeptide repeat protein [Deltaproteobacteria bacterium]
MKDENMSPNVSTGERIVKEWYKKPAVLSLFVIFSSFAVYINSLSGDFIWDDIEQIVENPVIKDIRNIPSFFTSDLWRLVSNPTISSYYYRPFFLLSLTVDYNLWGLNSIGYHITNLILHAIASFVVYLVGRRLLSNHIPAFIGSMLFAVHPIHVESVAWISGRTDPMAAVFFMLSFYLYMLFKDGKGIAMLILSIMSYLFSLFSKEMAIMLPIVLLAYEALFKPQWKSKYNIIKSLQVIGHYILVSVLYLYIRTVALGDTIGTSFSSSGMSFSSSPPLRLYTSLGITLDYLRIMILPINLKVLYDVPLKESIFDWQVIFSLCMLISIFVITILTYSKDRKIFFTSIWFFITALPISNIVPLRPTMMAERYMYIPSVGICLLVGCILYSVYQRNIQWSFYLKALLLAVITVFSFITFQRNGWWENDVVCFTKMVEDAPKNAYAHHNLGDAYRRMGNIGQAITEWEEAVRLNPYHSEANNSLGNIHLLQGNYTEAVRRYKIALKTMPENAESHYNIAIALEKLGNTEEAAFHYREFITRAPAQYRDVVEEVKSKPIVSR